MSEKLFVYGKLREKEIQKEVIGRIIEGKRFIIEGFSLSKISIERENYFAAMYDLDGKIEGKIIEVSKEELKVIDDYEGKEYERIYVEKNNMWIYVRSKIRAFIAVDFSDEIIKEVARVDELIGKKLFIGKFTELGNLHLTLKFLGEIDVIGIEDVKERLRRIEFDSFEVRVGEIGIFHVGKMRKPKIIWIKINGKGIWDLQSKIDDSLKDIFVKEERFMSHMTIARVKYVKDKKGFEEHIKNIKVKEIKLKVDFFKLKSSEIRENGSVYRDIEIYDL
jgi:2'-5' RNA ligase